MRDRRAEIEGDRQANWDHAVAIYARVAASLTGDFAAGTLEAE